MINLTSIFAYILQIFKFIFNIIDIRRQNTQITPEFVEMSDFLAYFYNELLV